MHTKSYVLLMYLFIYADQSSITFAPINICGGVATVEINNGEDDTFWSPSMAVPPHSPPFQNTSHEPRSAPPTPNNNRSGTSPPEAAIEATPETTPVKVYKNNLVIHMFSKGKREIFITFYTGSTKINNEANAFGI